MEQYATHKTMNINKRKSIFEILTPLHRFGALPNFLFPSIGLLELGQRTVDHSSSLPGVTMKTLIRQKEERKHDEDDHHSC